MQLYLMLLLLLWMTSCNGKTQQTASGQLQLSNLAQLSQLNSDTFATQLNLQFYTPANVLALFGKPNYIMGEEGSNDVALNYADFSLLFRRNQLMGVVYPENTLIRQTQTCKHIMLPGRLKFPYQTDKAKLQTNCWQSRFFAVSRLQLQYYNLLRDADLARSVSATVIIDSYNPQLWIAKSTDNIVLRFIQADNRDASKLMAQSRFRSSNITHQEYNCKIFSRQGQGEISVGSITDKLSLITDTIYASCQVGEALHVSIRYVNAYTTTLQSVSDSYQDLLYLLEQLHLPALLAQPDKAK